MKFSLRRLRLDRGGYTTDGRYFGVGRPLYEAEHLADNTPPDDYVLKVYRAWDREEAKENVSRDYPTATFYR